MDTTLFTLKFDDDMIEAVMQGKKSTLRKDAIYIEEEAEIQRLLFDNSKQHTKDLVHFKVENHKAVLIWKKLKGNGWN